MGTIINGVDDKEFFLAVITLGGAVITQIWAMSGAVWVKGDAGATRMSPKVFFLVMLLGFVEAGVIAIPIVEPARLERPNGWLLWYALVGLVTFAFLWSAISLIHRWAWDAKGLRFKGLFRSEFIPWTELTRIGLTWDAKFCAISRSGKTISWPQGILQHEALRSAIMMARPDLTLPPARLS